MRKGPHNAIVGGCVSRCLTRPARGRAAPFRSMRIPATPAVAALPAILDPNRSSKPHPLTGETNRHLAVPRFGGVS